MTNLQCDTLSEYVALWLQFRDPDLRAEIVSHRDTCQVCTRLREITIERRKRGPAYLHREIPIIFPDEITERLATIMRRLYEIVIIRPGDIGWVGDGSGSEGGRGIGGLRVGEPVGNVVSAAAVTE